MSTFERVVRRPVATWMIAIAAAVFGLVSYERLPLNLMPDLSYPTITVRTDTINRIERPNETLEDKQPTRPTT